MKAFYSSSDLQKKLSISRQRLNELKPCLKAGEDYIVIDSRRIFYKPSALEKLKTRQKENKRYRNKAPH